MAEDKQQNLTGVNIITSGLNFDDSPLSVSQGDYTYALNLGMQNLSGTANQATNYPGNSLCVTLTSGLYIIGSRRINIGHIIFSCDLAGTISQIGLLENCTYTILVNDSCLGFRITNQIQAEYKETYNCGRKVYWTDNLNARRFLDIDHIPYTNSTLKTIDCDATLVQPNIDYPCVYYYEIQETGGLHAGMYKPYIQYADINGIGYGDWFESMGNIPIFQDPVNSNFNSLQGSTSNEQTTKSINFLLSNIDTSYTHINIGVLTTHAGILAAYKVATIPSTSTEFLLTGLGTAYIDLTLDELLKQSTIYKKAKTVCQSNGYLLWGNLSGRKDPNFQPLANNIQVTWQTYQVPAYFTAYDSKSPYTTTFRKGFMRDEVYALGIRLVYKDGSKSCVYHIPGRELNMKADGTPIPFISGVTTDQYGAILNTGWDNSHSGGAASNFDNYSSTDINTPRYQIYNTGKYNIGDFAAGYDPSIYGGQCAQYGEMSYWESGLPYPNTLDENGVRIFPLGNIRHHKMPDASIIPLFDKIISPSVYSEPKLNYLGLNIDNVVIPNTSEYADVIGWELVVGDRTGNKSIIAKGLIYDTWRYTSGGIDFNFQTSLFNDTTTPSCTIGALVALNSNIFTFYSPDTTFKSSNLSVSEAKVEIIHFGDWNNSFTGVYNERNIPIKGNIRRDIKDISYMSANSMNTIGNITGTNVNTYAESNVWFQTEENTVGTINSDKIQPDAITVDNSLTGFCASATGGDISSYYTALKLSQPNQYNQLDNIDYLSVGMCPVDTTFLHCQFGGDTFLSNFTYHRSRIADLDLTIDPPSPGDTEYPSGGGIPPIVVTVVNNTWVESSINTELRYEGTDLWQKIYPNLTNTNQGVWVGLGIQELLSTDGLIQDNYYAYNDDYSSQNIGKYICSQSLEDRSDCLPHYKTRVIYTLRSQEESKEDYWLVERPNDLYDFPKKSGELWDMRELGQDKVLFRFENGIYAYPAYDTLETDANTIQLGTGGMFAQDPKELITTDTGYGGTRSQWAINSTEFGHFFLDDKRGAVFNLQGQINPISNVKMFNFFSKELKLKLLDYFPTFANYDNPANPEGIGFNSVYDDRFKIWLLTKKDYIPKIEGITYEDGVFKYNRDTISLNDKNYFCNKSYTIGYSAKYNRWISFYSFIPMNYLSSDLGFFSTLDNKIWQHHSDKFCTYYDETFDHIIEYVVKLQGEVTNKTSVQFITNAYDSNTYEIQNETFKQAICYDNEGCTGLLNLIVPDNTNLSTYFNLPQINLTDINISLENANRQIYKFNYLWNHLGDRRVNIPIFVSSCIPSVDKELNGAAINYQKPWNELARVSGQWMKCRLIYPNTTDNSINLVTTLAISKNTQDYF